MERTRCRARCSFLELLVLALLINEGEMHGYALRKKIISVTREHWNPSIGTIYRLLNNMSEKGLVDKSARGRRQVYTITQKGVEYFAKISRSIITRRVGVLTELLKAYSTLAAESPNLIGGHMEENIKALKKVLDNMWEALQESR